MSLDFVAVPLGHFLKFIYDTMAFGNYGVAIIIFTVVIKMVLLPLTIKQYRSTAKMQAVQPHLQEAQKRFKNDKEKLNQETLRIYKENNVNPAGGCLPLLVQMPILIALYWVIIQPLKFMLNKTPEQVTQLADYVTKLLSSTGGMKSVAYSQEIAIINYFNEHKDKLKGVANLLKPEELVNFNFLGLQLGHVPTYKPNEIFGPQASIYLPLLLIPIIAVITTYISAKLSMPKTVEGNQNPMANSMLYIGPVMTLIFSFTLPAGVALYWTIGYVIQIFQQLYINKYVMKRKEVVKK